MTDTEHAYGENCPHCGHTETQTVDAQIKGHGSMTTKAIVECQNCGTLWGEPRDFYGVVSGDSSE